MYNFEVGDFIAENYGRGPVEFGVVTEVGIHEGEVISVRFPKGEFYSFASHCQPYKEWLNESGF